MRQGVKEDIGTRYFEWLYTQMFSNQPRPSYKFVCSQMHQKVFKVLVPMDDNRVAQAAELRDMFLTHIDAGPMESADLLFPDVSIFEVLAQLARRADFMIEKSVEWWFLIFLQNLKLSPFTDDSLQRVADLDKRQQCFADVPATINRRLNRFNDRYYNAAGHGGLFPLRNPEHDQRSVELWYQMAAWMEENELY